MQTNAQSPREAGLVLLDRFVSPVDEDEGAGIQKKKKTRQKMPSKKACGSNRAGLTRTARAWGYHSKHHSLARLQSESAIDPRVLNGRKKRSPAYAQPDARYAARLREGRGSGNHLALRTGNDRAHSKFRQKAAPVSEGVRQPRLFVRHPSASCATTPADHRWQSQDPASCAGDGAGHGHAAEEVEF